MRLSFVLGALFATLVLELTYGFSEAIDKFVYITFVVCLAGAFFMLGYIFGKDQN